METDESRELLESLPELQADETFCFDCNPQVPCFNRCCAELTLPLTPYDVLRLRRHMGITSEEFLNTFATMRSFPDTGFPLPMLRMLQGPGEPCPFVGPAGCSVYEDRPGLPLLPAGARHQDGRERGGRTLFRGARAPLPRL